MYKYCIFSAIHTTKPTDFQVVVLQKSTMKMVHGYIDYIKVPFKEIQFTLQPYLQCLQVGILKD